MDPQIKTIIFDLGGVFISSDFGQKFLEDAENYLQISSKQIRQTMDNHENLYGRGKIDNYNFWLRVADELGKTAEDARFLSKAWFERYKQTTIDLQMVNLLRDLKESGYHVGVISNTQEPHIACDRELHKLFDTVVLSGELEMNKPDWEIFQAYLDILSVDIGETIEPKEAVFIDDAESNLLVPHQHGMNTIRFTGVDSCQEQLKDLGINWAEGAWEIKRGREGIPPQDERIRMS